MASIKGRRGFLANFAAQLKSARTRAGMTQEDLADRVGLTPRQVRNLESSRMGTTLLTLYDLAVVLDVPPSSLIGEPESD